MPVRLKRGASYRQKACAYWYALYRLNLSFQSPHLPKHRFRDHGQNSPPENVTFRAH